VSSGTHRALDCEALIAVDLNESRSVCPERIPDIG
jgi:hypothetical protein